MSVLIVDDHAGYRSTARRALEAEGWEVVAEAADAEIALEAVRDHRPGVALIDLELAGGDGLALAHAFAGEPDPPDVVIMSGWSEDDVSAAIASAPVRGFVSKSALSGRVLQEVLES